MKLPYLFLCFNSRPHEEVDLLLRGGLCKCTSVSTHDLTKRSTHSQVLLLHPYQRFNSRPHEEVDQTKQGDQTADFLFQLTTSRRGRLWLAGDAGRGGMFQLTTSRRGRRWSVMDAINRNSVSTHDLTKRSTQRCPDRMILIVCFNSRPHEEVDGDYDP